MRRHLVNPIYTRIVQVLTKDPDHCVAKVAEALLYAEKKQAEAVTAKAEAAFFACLIYTNSFSILTNKASADI
jgi:L-fucose mutarotase/ribose pyranase (RbsD/FucU family)